MKRSKHNLSHYRLASLDMAELVPVACYEVLPGDAVQQATSLLLRVSPLVTPVMHPVQVRLHHWFVPNRLLWANWENFITGGQDGLNASAHPYIDAGGGGFAAGALADYLGVKPGVANIRVNALPFRAYNLIWDTFYRDADLDTASGFVTTDGADATTPVTLKTVRWEKDTFTGARPWAQKGAQVTLPLGTSATVKTNATALVTGAQNALLLQRGDGTGLPANGVQVSTGTSGAFSETGTAAPAAVKTLYPSNLYADLTGATATDVNTVRRAFALQRFEEARAMYGSRYAEYLRYLGVRSKDARLQRPEYLGGGKQTIAFSEVLQTGTNFDANTGVAQLKGHGIAAMRSGRFRRFFDEHGIVLTLLSVRPRTMYGDAVPRMFWREAASKYDYYQRELEAIGQQEVYRREVYAETGATVFGYNDRYYEYRQLPSQVTGEFRTSVLNPWHLARLLGGAPTLNSSFVACDPSKRIHAVTTNDVLWVMANNHIVARRMVRRAGEMNRIV